jgi:ABC-type sugar transport system substrate-binding protein
MRKTAKGLIAKGICGVAACAVATLAATAANAQDKKDVTIALFVAIQSNPVEQAIINAFNKVAEEDGKARFVVFDSDNSVQKELSNCNDAIAAARYDAFALKPVAGPPLMACAEKALAAGIPVVAFGNALGPEPHTADRQIDGLSASVVELAKSNGIAVAELTNAACEAAGANPCNVIYTFGPLAFDWASITRKFFTETVEAEYSNINIVATGANNFDPNTARTLIKSLMQAHADTNVIASDGDLGAFGVIDALKDLGLKPGEDVLVTGGAISNQGKGLIESGEMFGSTCLMPITEAEMSATFSIQAARGEAIEQPDIEVCAAASPTGLDPITKDNVSMFTPEW